MSTEAAENTTSVADFHREIASELFNQVLALMERRDRTCSDNDRVGPAAHASRLPYEFGGTPLNLGLGEWQCARVHTLLCQVDSALYHGWRYLEISETYGLGPFHLSYAHTALAAAFLLKDRAEAVHHLDLAREYATHTT